MAEIGPVVPEIGSGGSRYGFNITDENGAPLLAMVYGNRDDAEVARCWAAAMVANVLVIAPSRRLRAA
jgi:hypothetical protein